MEGLQLDYRIPFPVFLSPNWKQLPAVALLQTLLLGADSASQWEALASQKFTTFPPCPLQLLELQHSLEKLCELPPPSATLCNAPSFCFLHELCWGELGKPARTS